MEKQVGSKDSDTNKKWIYETNFTISITWSSGKNSSKWKARPDVVALKELMSGISRIFVLPEVRFVVGFSRCASYALGLVI